MQSRLNPSPSPAVAAEPVAWECTDERYKYISGIVTTRAETVKAWREGGIKFTPLVRVADRATLYAILSKHIPQDMIDGIWQELVEAGQSGAGEREALQSIENEIEAKVLQLENYRDNDCQLQHAKTIAEGRILQARMDLCLVSRARKFFSRQAPHSSREGGR